VRKKKQDELLRIRRITCKLHFWALEDMKCGARAVSKIQISPDKQPFQIANLSANTHSKISRKEIDPGFLTDY
jgi:hypothetical protein